jgi:para-aminobenzoate synthetase component I
MLGRWSTMAFDPFGHFVARDGKAFWNGEALTEAPIAALRGMLQRFALAGDDRDIVAVAGRDRHRVL